MRSFVFALLFLVSGAVEAQNIVDTRQVRVATTVSTSPAYSSGDLIGGKLSFPEICPSRSGRGLLVSATIFDLSAQATDMDLVLFATDPSATTFTDNAVLDIDDADLTKIIAYIPFGSSSRATFNDNGIKFLGERAQPVRCQTSTGAPTRTLYGAIVSRGTPTFSNAADISVELKVIGD